MVVGFTTTYAINAWSPLTFWIPISLWWSLLNIILCDKVCQWLVAGWLFSAGTLVSSTIKTDHYDITEILLKHNNPNPFFYHWSKNTCKLNENRSETLIKIKSYDLLLLLLFFITVAIKYSMTSWINSYLCNHCPSPLKLWVWIPFIVTCTRYNFMWKSLSVTCDRSGGFLRYPWPIKLKYCWKWH
jgi:hypothetical protein